MTRPILAPAPASPPRDGGAPDGPFPSPPVLATLIVIGGDVMLFAGLLFGFWALRLAAPAWPPPLQPRLPLGITGLNTLILLASAPAVLIALQGLRRRDQRQLVRGLATAALLGGVFVLVQGCEWIRLIGFGLTISSGVYGGLFYTLVGAHAVHVAAALGWLLAILVLARRGRFAGGRTAPARACALYWYFVVALWPILYLSVYLV